MIGLNSVFGYRIFVNPIHVVCVYHKEFRPGKIEAYVKLTDGRGYFVEDSTVSVATMISKSLRSDFIVIDSDGEYFTCPE